MGSLSFGGDRLVAAYGRSMKDLAGTGKKLANEGAFRPGENVATKLKAGITLKSLLKRSVWMSC